MTERTFKRGQIWRIAGHCGVVVAVYERRDAPGVVLRMNFVKNAVRQLGSELVDIDMLPEQAVQPAAVRDMLAEWQELRARQQRYVDALVEEAGGEVQADG